MVLRVVALGIAALAVVAVACGGGEDVTEVSLACPSKESPQAPPDVASLSLEDVYEWMAEAMTCPGHALKVVTRYESEIVDPEEGALSGTVESNTWIDFSADRARGETRTELVSSDRDGNVIEEHKDSTVSIVVGDVSYRGETARDPHRRRGQMLVCRGSNSALLSLLLYCAGAEEDSVTRFETDAEYQGRRLPALVTEGSTTGEVGTHVFAQHLYLDADTLLPVHFVSEGTLNEQNPSKAEATYEYDFVPLYSLPEDFFDPAALPEPDPEEKLRGADVGIAVYWLGVEFPGSDGLPALSLRSARQVSPEPDIPAPGYRAVIDYRLAEDEFGHGVVGLQLFARAHWDAFLAQSRGGGFWDDPCVQKTEMDLGDRRAVVFGGYETPRGRSDQCPEEPPDKWGAYVYVGDTVVLVDAPGLVSRGEGYLPSPYSSREGMEAIIRGLVPRPSDD